MPDTDQDSFAQSLALAARRSLPPAVAELVIQAVGSEVRTDILVALQGMSPLPIPVGTRVAVGGCRGVVHPPPAPRVRVFLEGAWPADFPAYAVTVLDTPDGEG